MNREETKKAIDLYSLGIARKTRELYLQVSDTLNELILNDDTLKKAQKELTKVYDQALLETDFFDYFNTKTVDIIAEASYSEAVLNVCVLSIAEYKRVLPRVSLFDDDIILSKRIRKNYNQIVSEHKSILDDALSAGKGVISTAKKINDVGGFDPSIPEYIKDLERTRIAGKKLSQASLNKVRRQIDQIKTKGLKQSYNRLVNAIELDKNIDKAVENALVSKSRSYATRLARSETINTQASVKIARHAQDKNVKWIYSKTSGSSPCNFCKAMQDLGKVPFESAPKFIFHPNDSCTLHVVRDLEDVPKISEEEFTEKFNSSLKKFGKTSVPITKLRNLRENTIVDKINKL